MYFGMYTYTPASHPRGAESRVIVGQLILAHMQHVHAHNPFRENAHVAACCVLERESHKRSTDDASAILAQGSSFTEAHLCVVAIGTLLIHIHTYTPTHILLLTPCSTVHPVVNPNHHPCCIAANPFALPVLNSSRISVTCYYKHARRKTRVNPSGELLTTNYQ